MHTELAHDAPPQYIAFDGPRLVGIGSRMEVARAAKAHADSSTRTVPAGPLLVFDCLTSEPLELDLRGTLDEVLTRVGVPEMPPRSDDAPEQPSASTGRAGPGRPKLGVVAREVTLLPRHWQWLSEQPGGASVTIRRLVEEARGVSAERDRKRRAQESAYRFMSAMVGDQPGFEEATRSLFAGDAHRFSSFAAAWPHDLQNHARRLAAEAFV